LAAPGPHEREYDLLTAAPALPGGRPSKEETRAPGAHVYGRRRLVQLNAIRRAGEFVQDLYKDGLIDAKLAEKLGRPCANRSFSLPTVCFQCSRKRRSVRLDSLAASLQPLVAKLKNRPKVSLYDTHWWVLPIRAAILSCVHPHSSKRRATPGRGQEKWGLGY
jgi:hypothetical protein